MIYLIVFSIFSLVSCWIGGELNPRTKWMLTLIYLAIWLLRYFSLYAVYVFPITLALFGIVVAGMTFEIDWLMKQR
jgi:hypothetical protein